MKRHNHAQRALDEHLHPLTPNALRHYVNTLIWDGRIDDAFVVADYITNTHTHLREAEFHTWIGVWSTLMAIRGHREGARIRRQMAGVGVAPKRTKRTVIAESIAVIDLAKRGAS